MNPIVESNCRLKELNLQYNLVAKTSFAFSLIRNESLEKLLLAYNPLSFDNLMSLLEMLMNNRTLVELDIQGVHLDGPAPIKENCHGHLTSKEAVILKLASVLRYSVLRVLGIDIDLTATGQLQELESALIKHNRTLVELRCEGFSSSAPLQQPLLNIQRALKANRVLAECDDTSCLPETYPELEDILLIKANADRSFTPDSFVQVGDVSESMARSRQLRSISSSKIFQSMDSPSTIITSPEHQNSLQQALNLQRLSADFNDIKVPVSAETPQFSSYSQPMRRFVQDNHTRLEELMEFQTPSIDLGRRTPSTLGVTLATEQESRYGGSRSQLSTQLGHLHSALKILDQEVTRHLGNISNRQTTLEDKLENMQDDLEQLRQNDNATLKQKLERVESSSTACLSKTQRVLMSLEERLKSLESHLERDRASEGLQKELESLKNTQRQHSSQLDELSHVSDNPEFRETLLKLNEAQSKLSCRVENLASQLTLQRSKLDMSEIYSDLTLLRKHQEEDRSNTKNLQLRLEIQEAETTRISKLMKNFQKEVTNKLSKLEHQDRGDSQMQNSKQIERKFRQFELRLGGIEEAFNRWDHESMGSCSSSARNSVLKENRIDRKETKNTEGKESKKLNEVHDKITELNKRLERFEELMTHKLAVQSPQFLENTLPRESTRSPIPDRYTPLDRCFTREDLNQYKTYDAIEKSYDGPMVCRKDLGTYLPREAESVVLNAIIDRSNRTRLSETSRPRSNSTLASRQMEVPSRELTDSLRKRGFEIGERNMPVRELRPKY